MTEPFSALQDRITTIRDAKQWLIESDVWMSKKRMVSYLRFYDEQIEELEKSIHRESNLILSNATAKLLDMQLSCRK